MHYITHYFALFNVYYTLHYFGKCNALQRITITPLPGLAMQRTIDLQFYYVIADPKVDE